MTEEAKKETPEKVTIIRPRKGWMGLELAALWEFRELLWVMAVRDVKVRYKQTVLGGLWAVLQPMAIMVVFSIFFGKLAGLDQKIGDVPYPIWAFAALVPWTYFSNALSSSSMSVVEHRGIITKVYFPRIILPMAPLISGLVDFAVAMAVLVGMMLWYGMVPTIAVLALPGFVLLTMLTALSCGLLLSALNAHFRDFRYIVPFMLQFWLFATPIAYPSTIVPEHWRAFYGLNPMAGVIEGFRWALLGKGPAPGAMVAVSACIVLLLLAEGLAFFRRMERTFVDVV